MDENTLNTDSTDLPKTGPDFSSVQNKCLYSPALTFSLILKWTAFGKQVGI